MALVIVRSMDVSIHNLFGRKAFLVMAKQEKFIVKTPTGKTYDFDVAGLKTVLSKVDSSEVVIVHPFKTGFTTRQHMPEISGQLTGLKAKD